MPGPPPSPAVAGLAAGRAAALAALAEPGGGTTLPRKLSDAMDAYFRGRLAEVWPAGGRPPEASPFALAAVGGYGRRELCVHSDVDILVLYERAIPPEALDLAQSLLFPLWDLKYDLGHGFRSIKECLALAKEDFSVLAAVLDARFLAGRREVFADFAARLDDKVVARRRDRFTAWLAEQNRRRLGRYGDARALLEPDIKQGLGGLRDYHQMLWLGRVWRGAGSVEALVRSGQLTEAEGQVLADQAGYLFTVRNHLHLLAGRRIDRLDLFRQERIAEALGYGRVEPGSPDGARPVERFLARLRREMSWLRALHGSVFRSLPGLCAGRPAPCEREALAPGVLRQGGELAFDLPRGYPDDPLALARVFCAAARTGLPLSWAARRLVSGHLHLVKERLAQEPAAAAAFREVLASGRAAPVLEAMLETGYLAAFLPEFGRVQDLVQFDDYHIHPVGWHTVRAVACMEELAAGRGEERFAALWDEVADREALMLGVFFHDLGKGLGGAHPDKGADIAAAVLARWGAPAATAENAAFLVRRHLLLVEMATRRDLGDETAVASCAGLVGDRQRLAQLQLLAWADSRATGPRVWSAWTAGLLAELAAKVRRILDRGHLASARAVQRIGEAKALVRRLAAGRIPDRVLERGLEDMPARAFLTLEPEDILAHLDMAGRLADLVEEDRRRKPASVAGLGVVVFAARERPASGLWEATAAARDSPALFSAIAGVLALQDINILSAECFRWRDGGAVHIFRVVGLPDFLSPDEFWERVRLSLQAALTGRLSLDWRLAEKRSSFLARRSLDLPSSVVVDNMVSDFYTVLEVRAADRVGLLYDLASTLREQGLAVHLAKAATYGQAAADTFYVRDEGGQKLDDPARMESVRQALLRRLRQDPAPPAG
ncbi:MAG: [protein-PII] uridylyltransferase [Thermodesulfobacteriota bacterium]